MGEGGSVHDKAAPEVAASMRRLLAAIDAGQMACSKGYRRQLQCAVVALEAMAGCGQADAVGSRSLVSESSATARASAGHAEGLGDGRQGVQGSRDD